MAGAQHSAEVSRAPLVFGTVFCVASTVLGWGLITWGLSYRSVPAGRPLSGAPGRPPHYDYTEQSLFARTPTQGTAEASPEAESLDAYRWADSKHETAVIPIERAEQLLLLQRRGAKP